MCVNSTVPLSTHLWEDEEGAVHFIPQGEGGEHLRPPNACIILPGSMHRALGSLPVPQSHLGPTERLFAFLDDIYVVCSPDRVSQIHEDLRTQLWTHAKIQMHKGKTQAWNRGGVAPDGWERLDAEAQRSDPAAVVWRGNTMFPPSEQGVMVLGTPVGHWDFVKGKLEALSSEHQSLLEKIQHIGDLQSAWLLLLFCAASRANYTLRTVHPDASLSFAARHDISLRRCPSALLGADVPEDMWDIASLPLSVGGIGLRGAVRSRPAAYWSSWADSLEMIQQRHEPVCAQILHLLSRGGDSFHIEGAVRARQDLQRMGFDAPEWLPLAHGLRPRSQDRMMMALACQVTDGNMMLLAKSQMTS